MNLFDQNVPGLADLLSGQGAPVEQPTSVQGLAEVVQPAQAPAPAEPPAAEKSASGMFSSPEVKNMLMYGLLSLAKTGDVGQALQGAAIAGAGTRAEQERLRKETEDRDLAKRKSEQEMAIRNEDLSMRREEQGMKRENYASEREYRAAMTGKVKSETVREDDLHTANKAALQAKIDFVREQIATSKDSRFTEKLKRQQIILENRMKEIELGQAPAQAALKTRAMEVGVEKGQTDIAATNANIAHTQAATRSTEIGNEGSQIKNAKDAKLYEIFASSPEALQRQAALGLHGKQPLSEKEMLYQFAEKNKDAYMLPKGGMDVERLISDFNKLQNNGLPPEHQLKLKAQARGSVPVGAPYRDPVTGQTAIRRN